MPKGYSWCIICRDWVNTSNMERKTDPEIQENVDRGAKNEQGSAGIDPRNNNYNDDEVVNESDTIKNANAAGLGAIGRNDQKQTEYTSNHSTDAGNEG
jgi:hypothetical protein